MGGDVPAELGREMVIVFAPAAVRQKNNQRIGTRRVLIGIGILDGDLREEASYDPRSWFLDLCFFFSEG